MGLLKAGPPTVSDEVSGGCTRATPRRARVRGILNGCEGVFFFSDLGSASIDGPKASDGG